MKKFWIQIILLLAVIFAALYLAQNQQTLTAILPLPANYESKQIKINETLVNIEIADTANKRAQGLSGRESLATGSGMLFIFNDTKKDQFWMKGMKFPLDFVFIRDGKVVDLLKNIPPPPLNQADSALPIYQPVTPINMMLEVNAGFIDTNNIKVGDSVFLIEQ